MTLASRSEAVRRARGIADDVMRRRVVLVLVHAEDDRDVLALGRRADDDLPGAGRDVGLGLLGVREEARALEDDVDAELAPRQVGRVLLLEDPDLPAVNDQEVVRVVDDARVGSVRRIVLEQERVEGDGHQVVDGDDLDVRCALDEGLERLAADAAKTIDANAGSHRSSPCADHGPGERVAPGRVLGANGPAHVPGDRSRRTAHDPRGRDRSGDLGCDLAG